ncbi:MAG: putative toxin-antitoxin system toxin component, PIN family [archaeon]|nr:putative toxin-antitoxin system toxin component, PIN family [archaeon]
MIKVVLDTNIFVSSIFWEKGNPKKIIDLALNQKFRVFVSLDILEELKKVLERDFEQPEEKIQVQLNIIMSFAELIEIKEQIDFIKSDPADNKILDCAFSIRADFIVSGDNHLLELKEFKEIRIVSPKEFLEFFT